jgi:DNA polymerase-3 subunit alpha
VAPWPRLERGKHEKDVLGFYWTDPLDEHRDALQRFANTTLASLHGLSADTIVIVGGMLTRLRTTLTKTGRSAGQKMAMFTLSDGNDSVEAVAFAETYAQYAPLLEADKVVFLRGRVDRRREETGIIVDAVIPATDAPRELTRTVLIALQAPNADPPGPHNGNGRKPLNGELAKLKTLLMQSRYSGRADSSSSAGGGGGAEVLIEVHQAGQTAQLRVNGLRVAVDAELPQRVRTVLGEAGQCELLGLPKLKADPSTTPPRSAQPDLPIFADSGESCASIDRY